MRGHDAAFTKLLARRGLIGLTWPEPLGGSDAGNVERLVVTEELLRVGAPVAAHWIADRQIGPAILRYGSPELQQEFLPRIAAGDVTFCLGMSESESGSDLAAVRTKAVRDEDTFRITGRKIWTSHAHRSTHAYVLARTGGGERKHEGLSEFVVDLSSPGVEIRPIPDLAGEHHFNETIFDDVVVPERHLIGEAGNGWRQVTEQLAFERGGIERVLSSYPLLARILDGGAASVDENDPGPDLAELGRLVARLSTLRAMAHAVAVAMDTGEAPTHRAALLKHLGTTFEGEVVEHARHALGRSPDPAAAGFEGLLASGLVTGPGATLRGGTTEVLLTIIGRQELSAKPPRDDAAGAEDLRGLMDAALGSLERPEVGRPDAPAKMSAAWDMAVELGWTGVGVDESAGGSGGSIRDLSVVAAALARHGRSAPVVTTAVAGGVLAAAGQDFDGSVPVAVAVGTGVRLETRGETVVLNGRLPRVPWAQLAQVALVRAAGPGGAVLVRVPLDAPGVSVTAGANLAGEPRDTLELVDVSVPAASIVGGRQETEGLRGLVAVLHCVGIVGALEAATASAREHVLTREQFGKPLASFQAVAHHIARMAADVAAAKVAVDEALAEVEAQRPGWKAVAGSIMASRAATTVAKTAHQTVGAMGITQEHELHISTLRLWAWRDEIAGERSLAERLGGAATAAGEAGTWAWVVQETDELGATVASPWEEEQ